MVEIAVVMVILLVSSSMVLDIVVSTSSQRRINAENSRAANAARETLETIRAEPVADVFALYNASTVDDPRPDAPGSQFRVPGLQDAAGSDLVGRVEFPVVGDQLREDVNEPILGMPRDLNGDRRVDALDHAGDYGYLPVRVVVEWAARSGTRRFELNTTLVEFTF